jgi:hypothetical protein
MNNDQLTNELNRIWKAINRDIYKKNEHNIKKKWSMDKIIKFIFDFMDYEALSDKERFMIVSFSKKFDRSGCLSFKEIEEIEKVFKK